MGTLADVKLTMTELHLLREVVAQGGGGYALRDEAGYRSYENDLHHTAMWNLEASKLVIRGGNNLYYATYGGQQVIAADARGEGAE